MDDSTLVVIIVGALFIGFGAFSIYFCRDSVQKKYGLIDEAPSKIDSAIIVQADYRKRLK